MVVFSLVVVMVFFVFSLVVVMVFFMFSLFTLSMMVVMMVVFFMLSLFTLMMMMMMMVVFFFLSFFPLAVVVVLALMMIVFEQSVDQGLKFLVCVNAGDNTHKVSLFGSIALEFLQFLFRVSYEAQFRRLPKRVRKE